VEAHFKIAIVESRGIDDFPCGVNGGVFSFDSLQKSPPSRSNDSQAALTCSPKEVNSFAVEALSTCVSRAVKSTPSQSNHQDAKEDAPPNIEEYIILLSTVAMAVIG